MHPVSGITFWGNTQASWSWRPVMLIWSQSIWEEPQESSPTAAYSFPVATLGGSIIVRHRSFTPILHGQAAVSAREGLLLLKLPTVGWCGVSSDPFCDTHRNVKYLLFCGSRISLVDICISIRTSTQQIIIQNMQYKTRTNCYTTHCIINYITTTTNTCTSTEDYTVVFVYFRQFLVLFGYFSVLFANYHR